MANAYFRVADQAQRHYPTPNDALQVLFDEVQKVGFGRVVCDLLRGKFSAYLTVVLGRTVLCEEIKCESVNGDFCEFHAYSLALDESVGSEAGA